MNNWNRIGYFLATVAMLARGGQARADIALTSGAASVTLDPTSQRGLSSYTMGGQNYLNQQWFWYRVGPGPILPIDTISPPSIIGSPGSWNLAVTYSNAVLSITVSYNLSAAGSYADLLKVVDVNNNTPTPLLLTLFEYSDFDLSPGGAQDWVQGIGDMQIHQWSGSVNAYEQSLDLPNTVFEVGPAGSILDRLTNNAGASLNGYAGPLSGNVSWAFQWDVALAAAGAPHGSSVFSLANDIAITATTNQPPTVSIVLPTNGSTFILSQPITIVAQAQDSDGWVTNTLLRANSNLLARSTTAPLVFVWTNAPAGAITLGAEAADNLGAQGTSAPVAITVLERPPIAAGPITLNRQTGLFEQPVLITNPSPLAFDGVRVLVQNLASWDTVYNASGVTNGVPFLQTLQPLGPGQNVSLVILYYTVDYRVVPPPTLTPQLLSFPAPSPARDILRIDRLTSLADGSVRLDFTAPTNRTCYIQYSPDLVTWRSALPAVVVSTAPAQWIDNGPPLTESQPASGPCRFYRVLVLP